jgi:hypothetical protein
MKLHTYSVSLMKVISCFMVSVKLQHFCTILSELLASIFREENQLIQDMYFMAILQYRMLERNSPYCINTRM